MRAKKLWRPVMGVVVLAFVFMSAYTSTAAPAPKPVVGAKPNEALSALHQKARKEGSVVMWGPSEDQMRWIPDEFAKDFPGVEVQWTVQNAAEIPTKLISQQRAGRVSVDVTVGSLRDFLPLHERGILGTFDWTGVFGVPAKNLYFDGAAVRRYSQIFGLVYNSEKIKKNDLPKKWDDLLDAKWQGKIQGDDFLLPAELGFLGIEWGEQKTTEFAKALRDKAKIIITASNQQLLLSGERPLYLGLSHHPIQWKWSANNQSLPINSTVLSPTGATRHISGFMKEGPHPNAARLLVGWLAGPRAEELMWKYAGQGDPTPGSGTEVSKQMEALGIKLIFESPEIMKERARLVGVFRKLLVEGR